MAVIIRPLRPPDTAACETLIQAALPEGAPSFERWLRGEPGDRRDGASSPFVVAADDQTRELVGYGATWPQGEDRFRLDLAVAEGRRRRGVGEMLLRNLLDDLRARGARLVQARAPADRAEVLDFLAKHGFLESNRMVRLRLITSEADLRPFPPLIATLDSQGITLTTLARLEIEGGRHSARLIELLRAAAPGRADPYVPACDPTPSAPGSYAEAEQVLSTYYPLSAGAFFIARRGAEYLGLSCLQPGESPGLLAQGDTAVHAAWRRRGIGTALKFRAIEYARRHGYAAIVTNTASPGMLALNETLGFHRESVQVRLVRTLRGSQAPDPDAI